MFRAALNPGQRSCFEKHPEMAEVGFDPMDEGRFVADCSIGMILLAEPVPDQHRYAGGLTPGTNESKNERLVSRI